MNIEKGLVEIGGDLFGFGKIWTVGILDPKTRKPLYRLKIKNRAVMTSGDYERFFKKNGRIYSHILDPRTGRPALVKAHSVTVIGPEAAVADALATAFFILGEKKSFQILENFYPGYSAFFILPNQSTVKSIYFPYTLERIRNNL
jgi:thiamine biosynthesis lipoprotein